MRKRSSNIRHNKFSNHPIILAHLSHRIKVSFCDPMMSVVGHQSWICFKQHLLHNHRVDCHQISQEWSLGGPLTKLFKEFHSMQNSGCHGNQKKNLKKKCYCQKLQVRFQNNFVQKVVGWPSTKDFQFFLLVVKYCRQGAWPVFPMLI